MGTDALHVFVCFGALPFEASLRILAELRRADASCAAAFVLTFEADASRLPANVRVFRLSPPMQTYSRWEKPFKVAAWFEQVHREVLAMAPGPLHVYMAHPAELPGNHFLFRKRPGDEVDLLPDGLLNYVHSSLRPERCARWPRYLVRVALETVAAKLHGFSYVPLLSGHQTQFERGLYDASWTFRPEGYLTRCGDLKVVPRAEAPRASQSKDEGPVVLFLDQELHGIVDGDLEAEMRAVASRVLGEQAPSRVLYKAHPRGKNRVDELRRAGLTVEDASGPTPAETLAELHEVAAVVGFYSTTLLLLSGSQVGRLIAILPRAEQASVRRPELVEQTTQAFLATGVHVVQSGSFPFVGRGRV
jgi:hypothetical protein